MYYVTMPGGLLGTFNAAAVQDDLTLEEQLPTRPLPLAISYTGQDAVVVIEKHSESETKKELKHQVDDLFFFQPVIDGRSVSYTTFLGEQLSFDLLAQPFKIKHAEFDHGNGHTSLASVTAMAEGEPMTCWLGDTDFETLSGSLQVWHGGDVSYHISKPMNLGCA